jgi:transcriptional regulator with XRE-family HTH domain
LSTKTDDPFLIDVLRELKGLSLRKLAEKSGLDPSSLSYWIRGKENRVSRERLKNAKLVLGISDSGLLTGIHRWVIPSPTSSDMEKAEHLIRELSPGGVKVYPVYSDILTQAPTSASIIDHLSWILWVLAPITSTDVRIVLSIKPPNKRGFLPKSYRSLSLPNFSGVISDGSSPKEIPSSVWKALLPQFFERIHSDAGLTIPDSDSILGISGNSEWTWERVVARLNAKGISPEETARLMELF